MLKIIKAGIFLGVTLLILNSLGFLSPEASKFVTDTKNKTVETIGNIEYKGKNLKDMTLGELSDNITSDVKNIKEKTVIDGGVKFEAGSLKATLTPGKDTVLYAEVETDDTEAMESLKNMVKNLGDKAFEFTEENLKAPKLVITVVNVDGGLKTEVKTK